MNKHTPGPWQMKINVASTCVLDGKGTLLARLQFGCNFNERVVSNARLMTAAPDLLEVLKSLEKDFGCSVSGVPYPRWDSARAAIAKAEAA
ncbi:MAG: hypothetical protein ACO3IZ_11125 [Steroidobacteraceae bacterium]